MQAETELVESRMPPRSLSAIVLAGGKSTRMGQDKRLLEVGGQSLLDLVVGKVRALTSDVVVSGSLVPGTISVEDAPSLAGPAAGIVAGLDAVSSSAALVLACDMPFVTEALLEHLFVLGQAGSLAVVPRTEERWEPLCAVYSKRCADLLRQECTRERSALKVFLDAHRGDILQLSETELAQFGNPDELFANLNTPADVEAARARL